MLPPAAQQGVPAAPAPLAPESAGTSPATTPQSIQQSVADVGASDTATTLAIPKHMRMWYYYGGLYVNGGLPASYVAAHADFVTIGANQAMADNFINAGGKYAVYYTDPHLIPNCSGTRCTGPMGSTTPETAWYHSSSGARLTTSSHQDSLNITSTAVPTAYHNYLTGLLAGHKVNAVFSDDTEAIYDPTYFTYKFGALARELTSLGTLASSKFFAGQVALVQAATHPVVYNGTGAESPTQTLLTATNTLGRLDEGCAVSYAWRVNDNQGNPANQWTPEMNYMLFAYAHHKYGICLSTNVTGGNPIGDRLYGFASSMLIFDPTYSVTFADYSSLDSAGGQPVHIFPEYDIYPTAPLSSPGTNITTLKTSTGVFVREFGACYQAGVAIGRCAAVLNSSNTLTRSIPALRQSYTRHLVLDGHSSYGGGKAAWSAGRPTTLAPETGLVLLQ